MGNLEENVTPDTFLVSGTEKFIETRTYFNKYKKILNAIDMGNFYRVPCDKRDLNYDNYFKNGNTERCKLTEFNSNNTERLELEAVMDKIYSLDYIKEEMAKDGITR